LNGTLSHHAWRSAAHLVGCGKAAATQPAPAACFVQRSGETNFRVRNCRIIHLKSLDQLGLLIVFFCATVSVAAIRHGGCDEQQAS
jgi:hypothetical protein